jgi:hypothetical protein
LTACWQASMAMSLEKLVRDRASERLVAPRYGSGIFVISLGPSWRARSPALCTKGPT